MTRSIVKSEEKATVSGGDQELARTYGGDTWLEHLHSIPDDQAFRVAATERVMFLGRLSVLSAVGIGRVLLAAKDRMRGNFYDWLNDIDLCDRTARRYMVFARHAGSILESKQLQKLSLSHVAALTALPDNEFDKIAKGDRIAGKSLAEYGALSPSEARRYVNRVLKLEAEADKGREQLDAKDAELDSMRTRLTEALKGEGGKLPENDTDERYATFIARVESQFFDLYKLLVGTPPTTGAQAGKLVGLCNLMGITAATWPYSQTLMQGYPPDVRDAMSAQREFVVEEAGG